MRDDLAVRDGSQVFSYPMYRDLEAQQRVFSGLAAHYDFFANLSYGSATSFDRAMLVSGSYFGVLKLKPALGRLIGPQDARRVGESPVAVLSYGYWQDRLGADPSIIGKTLTVNAQSLTIIGVAPKGFRGTMRGWDPVIFVPITLRWLMQPEAPHNDENRQAYWLYMFARLKPGLSRKQAQAQLDGLYGNILRNVDSPALKNVPERFKKRYLAEHIVLEPGMRGQVYTHVTATNPLTLALGVTVFVLLIVCGNIANLLLARGASRAGEMAIRASLGATRRQLVTQLLTESAVLATLGGLLSYPVALLTLRLVSAIYPGRLAAVPSFAAAVFAAGATLVTLMIFALVPALSTGRADAAAAIKEQSGQSPGGRGVTRFRNVLAAFQIALSLALLVLAGLFTRSLVKVSHIDLGMNDSVVGFSVTAVLNGEKGTALDATYDRVRERIAALPGVESVASTAVPLEENFATDANVSVVGSKDRSRNKVAQTHPMTSPGFFKTLSIPLLAGRDFTKADDTRKVAIVNQRFVRTFGLGTGAGAVGRIIHLYGAYIPHGPVEIVGVVADAHYAAVKQRVRPQVFTPRPPHDASFNSLFYYVHAKVDPSALESTIRRVMKRIDPTLPVSNLTTLRRLVESNTSTDRMMSVLSAAFAGLATLLAAIGLYGVLVFNITQRKREMGLRLALGATPHGLRMLVLNEVLIMGSIGGAVGLAAALGAGRLAQGLLYGISEFDPLVLVAAVVVIGAVLVAASYFPARRASDVAPMEALRYE